MDVRAHARTQIRTTLTTARGNPTQTKMEMKDESIETQSNDLLKGSVA